MGLMYDMYNKLKLASFIFLAYGSKYRIQRERAASFRGTQLQEVHVLRPLRFVAVRFDQTGPTVRGMLSKCPQEVPEECRQQLRHQHETNGRNTVSYR